MKKTSEILEQYYCRAEFCLANLNMNLPVEALENLKSKTSDIGSGSFPKPITLTDKH